MSLRKSHAQRLTALEFVQQSHAGTLGDHRSTIDNLNADLTLAEEKLAKLIDRVEADSPATKNLSIDVSKLGTISGGYIPFRPRSYVLGDDFTLQAVTAGAQSKPTPSAAAQVAEALTLVIEHFGLEEQYPATSPFHRRPGNYNTDLFLADLKRTAKEHAEHDALHSAFDRLNGGHDFDDTPTPDNVTSIFKGGDAA